MSKYPKDRKNYWTNRKRRFLYSSLMPFLIKNYFPYAKSAIDVGCYVGGLICDLDYIPNRVAMDLNDWSDEWKDVHDVKFIKGDAFKLDLDKKYDLVISNQTIEHVNDPPQFINNLLSIGRGLIISTTFEVPAGDIEGHIQDPIDFDKFRKWFPCPLDNISAHRIENIPKWQNIVGVVSDSHPNR